MNTQQTNITQVNILDANIFQDEYDDDNKK